jgi:predicted lipid-binding transport protein (Tim44 family)
MQKLGIVMVVALATAAFVLSDLADAKRLGGGGGLGMQRQGIAPRPPAAAPGAAAQPVMPAQPGAALPAKSAAAGAAAPAASGMSRWMGPIAGLAAGLGLAALLSHFGLPEGLGSFLLLALLVVGAVVVVRMLMARRAPPKPAMQYAGGTEPSVGQTRYQSDPAPVWGGAQRQEPAMPAAGSTGIPAARPFPPGFDAVGFARQAKLQFTRLQGAYDTGDRATMAEVMTPEMYAEVSRELGARGEHKPTEIVSLEAAVLEVTTEDASHLASVRYTGLVREDGDSNPKPLDEIWNLTKPVDGSSGWLLAGIQQTA